MTRHGSRRAFVLPTAAVLLAFTVAILPTSDSPKRGDVPVFRVYASNHLTTAMNFMACSEAAPTLTPVDWCNYHYHRMMHRIWSLAAEIKGEPQIVLGKKYGS